MAQPLMGPFADLCAAARALADEEDVDLGSVPCAALEGGRSESLEGDDVEPGQVETYSLELTLSAAVTPPLLQAAWLRVDSDPSSGGICGLLVRGASGYFVHPFGICHRTGRGDYALSATLRAVPTGPGGEGRLLAEVTRREGHATEGSAASVDTVICGAGEGGAVSCVRIPTAQSFDPREAATSSPEEEGLAETEPASAWSLYVGLQSRDRLWISPHSPAPAGREAPASGLYRIEFP